MYFGPGTATARRRMLEDLADLFEQGAADGTPIREIVGEDPVEFVETFVRNYPEGSGHPGAGTADQRHRRAPHGEDTGDEGTSR